MLYGGITAPGDIASVIDTAKDTVVGATEVGVGPDDAAVSADGAHVYVVDNGSDDVSGYRHERASPVSGQAEGKGIMDDSAVSILVRRTIGEVIGVSGAHLHDEVNLRTDHAVDSLELMEIAERLESACRVRLQAEEVIGVVRVGDLIKIVSQQLDGRLDWTRCRFS